MMSSRSAVLARMAKEVDELERSSAAPITLTIADESRSDVRLRWSVLGPLGALAACAAIAVGIVLSPSGSSPPPLAIKPPLKSALPARERAAAADTKLEPLPAPVQPGPDESAIVLAIVESPNGDVQCVSWTRHDPSSSAGHALTPADLARQVCRADCVPGPHWLLAAKVSGPRRLLPSGDEEVQALAQCIIGEHAERCDGGPMVLAAGSGGGGGAGAQCIPAGMRVVVERRSLASP
jgi:hypothetical protein